MSCHLPQRRLRGGLVLELREGDRVRLGDEVRTVVRIIPGLVRFGAPEADVAAGGWVLSRSEPRWHVYAQIEGQVEWTKGSRAKVRLVAPRDVRLGLAGEGV